MKKTGKILAAFLTLLLILTVSLTGCTKKGNDSNSTNNTTSNSTSGLKRAATKTKAEFKNYTTNELSGDTYLNIQRDAYNSSRTLVNTSTAVDQDYPIIKSPTSVTLKMAVLYNALRMKFVDETDYQAADGTTYRAGDFKPTWKAIQTNLNFIIDDVTPASATTVRGSYDLLKTNNFQGVNILNGNAVDINENGQTGSFVKLDEKLDQMPNFKNFLNKNSIVKETITAGDGHIYYSPYFDGYDDLERMIMVRTDWVEKLLDVDDTVAYDTTDAAATAYVNYMPASAADGDITITTLNEKGTGTQEVKKIYAKNIICVQNELETKNGATYTKALKAHLKATYLDKGYVTKLSDVFCGYNACYDADELVALLRCVVNNSVYLTGKTGVVGIFPRQSTAQRMSDLLSLVSIWGVRGMESRKDYLYFDETGVLQDARLQNATYDGIEKLHQLYSEGLILQNFDTKEAGGDAKGDHRKGLLNSGMGFLTYDYNQTTTIFNDTVNKTNPSKDPYAGENFNFTAIQLPVAQWETGKYYQFTESWRSVKTDGWCITATTTGEQLNRALQLFDYMFSKDGNTLMSYGPSAWISGTTTYLGESVPKLSNAALNELASLESGNYTNYYRKWLGATFPIGYVKQQGMEYQCVSEAGKAGLNVVNKAIELGVLKHLVVNKADTSNKLFWMVPTTLPTTAGQDEILLSSCDTFEKKFEKTSSGVNIFTDYVICGFGYAG